MGTSTGGSPIRRLIPNFIRQGHAWLWANQAWPDFRLGYLEALRDIERTGLIPKTEEKRRKCADQALKRLVDNA